MSQDVKQVFWIIFVVLISAISACSPKTLSVFFDGVPVPIDTLKTENDSSALSSGSSEVNETIAVGSTPGFNIHAPYQNKECFSCHNENSMGKLILIQPDLCYQCHDNFSEKYSFLHAPVELGECNACHNPHLLVTSKLLIETGQQL